ncbi:MAG: DUF192 domain-containing protein [Candidatus Omnitrophica bacterium]|nr:DUF192 domain-containing protein [Candidatus Omnitrophota bacterium]
MKRIVGFFLFWIPAFAGMIFLTSPLAYAASACVKDVCVKVEVVRSSEDMRRGLQGREGLADHQGMLFVFESEDIQRFWMKDMKFAIDMLWIDASNRIVSIASSVAPCQKDPCEVYASSQKALYVLEIPAGFSLKNNLRMGDVFQFKDIN